MSIMEQKRQEQLEASLEMQAEMQQKTRRCLCGQPAGSFGYCIDCEKDLEEAYREEQDLMQMLFE